MGQYFMLSPCKDDLAETEERVSRTRACACDDGSLASEGESHPRAFSRTDGTLAMIVEDLKSIVEARQSGLNVSCSLHCRSIYSVISPHCT